MKQAKVVRVRDLKNQIGKSGPHPLIHCRICDAEYSANKGDYWDARPEHVFECCGAPCALVVKRTVFELVS